MCHYVNQLFSIILHISKSCSKFVHQFSSFAWLVASCFIIFHLGISSMFVIFHPCPSIFIIFGILVFIVRHDFYDASCFLHVASFSSILRCFHSVFTICYALSTFVFITVMFCHGVSYLTCSFLFDVLILRFVTVAVFSHRNPHV